jgi:hypothetical protein
LKYLESPAGTGPPRLFLAGGITDCPDWQSVLVEDLAHLDVIVYNPRRREFDVSDLSHTEEQIRWEYRHLRRADAVLFWFPSETLCPIVLFELGVQSAIAGRTIFVGVHPEYKRRADVLVQMSLVRPDVEVVHSIADLFIQTADWIRSF